MPAIYDKMGIRFMYPENWNLEEEDAVRGEASVSVYSPGGGFWSIVLRSRATDPKALTLQALQAMQTEYAGLEAEPVSETIGDKQTTGYDLSFFYLDLNSTALVRSFQTENATCVVFCQAEDREFREVEPVFRAMLASVATPEAGP